MSLTCSFTFGSSSGTNTGYPVNTGFFFSIGVFFHSFCKYLYNASLSVFPLYCFCFRTLSLKTVVFSYNVYK